MDNKKIVGGVFEQWKRKLKDIDIAGKIRANPPLWRWSLQV